MPTESNGARYYKSINLSMFTKLKNYTLNKYNQLGMGDDGN
jgi:hypothetical protein